MTKRKEPDWMGANAWYISTWFYVIVILTFLVSIVTRSFENQTEKWHEQFSDKPLEQNGASMQFACNDLPPTKDSASQNNKTNKAWVIKWQAPVPTRPARRMQLPLFKRKFRRIRWVCARGDRACLNATRWNFSQSLIWIGCHFLKELLWILSCHKTTIPKYATSNRCSNPWAR